MALCPKSCTEDSIFRFNLPVFVLAFVVCFSFGRSQPPLAPPLPLESHCSILGCAGMMPLAVVLSDYLLKGCVFVTDRACLRKSYLVD